MTSIEDLKNALKETLEQKGVLNQIRAIMRQSIFEAIESDDKPQAKLSNENLIINELIKEFNFNKYVQYKYISRLLSLKFLFLRFINIFSF